MGSEIRADSLLTIFPVGCLPLYLNSIFILKSFLKKNSLEKETATHSSIFAWEIPWTGEPGGLQSMGSQKELDTT